MRRRGQTGKQLLGLKDTYTLLEVERESTISHSADNSLLKRGNGPVVRQSDEDESLGQSDNMAEGRSGLPGNPGKLRGIDNIHNIITQC
jgi:hypothetical protein